VCNIEWRGLIIIATVLAAGPVHAAELASVVNTIRAQGCAGLRGVKIPVRPSASLDKVARQLSQGGQLSAALERGGYMAARSASIHIEGTDEAAAVDRVLRKQYCATVINPVFSEIGVFQRGASTWLVLADPVSAPDPADQEAIARQVLERVNAARQQDRKCGRREFGAAHPLELSPTLSQVAMEHARDMANHGKMSHRGSDGSEPAQRVTRAGYRWRTTAENVAAGQPGAEAVVAHWLNSPGHCANLMGTQFTQMGVAFAIDPRDSARVYWAQVLATPR
jgi:uncharacterized protein YkwD